MAAEIENRPCIPFPVNTPSNLFFSATSILSHRCARTCGPSREYATSRSHCGSWDCWRGVMVGALMGMRGPTPPWRSMFWRMLEKKAGAPGMWDGWLVVVWVKSGDSLHSRARRVVASTLGASLVGRGLGRKRGVEGD